MQSDSRCYKFSVPSHSAKSTILRRLRCRRVRCPKKYAFRIGIHPLSVSCNLKASEPKCGKPAA